MSQGTYATFTEVLRTELARYCLTLVDANLGRGPQNLVVWTTTYQDWSGATLLHRTRLPADTPVHAEATALIVARRVAEDR